MKTILKQILIMVFTFLAGNSISQTADWVWAVAAGGTGSDAGLVIIGNQNGDIYTAGYFKGTASFGSYSLTAPGTYADAYLAKYNSAGNIIWVTSLSGLATEIVYDIALDIDENIYISGTFSGSMTIGHLTITAQSSSSATDIYVAKFSKDGKVVWARAIGNYAQEMFGFVASSGTEIYVAGSYKDVLVVDSDSVTSKGGSDIFVLKLDTAGNTKWLRSIGGTSTVHPKGIGVSGDCVFLTGSFVDTLYVDEHFVVGQKVSDVFIASLNSSGKGKWVKSALGEYGNYPNAMCADNSGNAYVTGTFGQTINFDGKSLTCSGLVDIFVAKYDSNGNCVWAIRDGSTNYDQGYGIYADQTSVAVTGFFRDNSKIAGKSLSSFGGNDIFIAEYDVNGNPLWAKNCGGTNWDFGEGICKAGNAIYATGYFSKNATFGSTKFNNTSNGQDIYICKIGIPAPPSVIIVKQPQNMTICENDSAYFEIAATGKNLKYQWKLNGNLIANATDSFLAISVADKADAGNYSCEVSDSSYSVTSNEATLIVGVGPVISTQPINKTAMKNTSVTFTVAATGINLTYQWQKNAVDVNGANASSYTITGLSYNDTGTYSCIINDKCGTITSNPAYLTVTHNTSISETSNEIGIYPNPAEKRFIIKFPDDLHYMLEIFDIRGTLVYKGESFNKKEHFVDLSTVPEGIYLLKCYSGKVFYTKKLLIR